VTAGDEESFEVFKELFDAVIAARHSGYAVAEEQPTDLDASKLLLTDIDPYNAYVLTTRVRTGRSVRGFRLPPTIGFEERRKLEAICVNGLLQMTGDLRGDYYPLHGSQSYTQKPNGMTSSDEANFRSLGHLFQEPDSTLLLSSGIGRHWPDARGIFCNESRNLFVWVGEEDHLRIVCMQGDKCRPTHAGKQIKQVFVRFLDACAQVRSAIQQHGYDFMWNRHHGWILTCPSNRGTGLRVGVLVRLPRLSALTAFREVLAVMGLQARGTNGVDSAASGGIWDVSNADRIGKSEVELCNVVIAGVRQLVDWEHLLQTATNQNGNVQRVATEIAAKLDGA
jgi:creatine kinase